VAAAPERHAGALRAHGDTRSRERDLRRRRIDRRPRLRGHRSHRAQRGGNHLPGGDGRGRRGDADGPRRARCRLGPGDVRRAGADCARNRAVARQVRRTAERSAPRLLSEQEFQPRLRRHAVRVHRRAACVSLFRRAGLQSDVCRHADDRPPRHGHFERTCHLGHARPRGGAAHRQVRDDAEDFHVSLLIDGRRLRCPGSRVVS